MAAHPPTGPQPSDGSDVFRRPKAKSSTHLNAPLSDDLSPEEPTELVEFEPDDEESMPIGHRSTSQVDPDQVATEALFEDEDDLNPTEPLPELRNPGQRPAPEPISTPPPATDPTLPWNVPPTIPSAGWYDDPTSINPTDVSNWGDDPPVPMPQPDSDSYPLDNSNVFLATGVKKPHSGTPLDSGEPLAGPESGVQSSIFTTPVTPNLLPPDTPEIPLLGATSAGTKPGPHPPADMGSSIFDRNRGKHPTPTQPPSPERSVPEPLPIPDEAPASGRIQLDSPFTGDDIEHTMRAASPEEMGWDQTIPEPKSEHPAPRKPDDSQAVSLGQALDTPLAVGAAAVTRRGRTDEPKKAKPTQSADQSAEDEALAEEKTGFGRSSGFGKFAGGAAFGLLTSGVTFAALYLSGVIPNGPKESVKVPSQPAATNSDLPAKLTELQAQLEGANTAKNEQAKLLEDAKKEAATFKEQLLTAEKTANQATESLKTVQTELTTAKADLATATKAADALKLELANANKPNETIKTLQTELTKAKMIAETASKEVTDARTAAETAKKNLETVTAEADAAKKEVTTLKADLDTAKKAATDAAKMVTQAETKARDAEKKLQDSQTSLTELVKELKANKILAEGDDLTKLPAAVKQLVATSTSTDAKKAAEALLAAQKELDTAKANLKMAESEVTKAKMDAMTAATALEKVKADAEKQITTAKADADKQILAVKAESEKLLMEAKKGVDDQVKAAVEQVRKESRKMIDDVQAQATAAVKKAATDLETAKAMVKADAEAAAKQKIDDAMTRLAAVESARTADLKTYEQKLADQAAQFAARLADAKAGAIVSIAATDSAAVEKAAKGYGDGMTLFLSGRYTDAESLFQGATTQNASDARYWYFLGLSQYQQGRTTDAATSFRKGAELEARNKPGTKAVSDSLERVPFALRRVLAEYRP
jgi:uncharacterized coiled-coil DUF342 family protein